MSKDSKSFAEKLGGIFLEKSGIKNSFDKAYETFMDLSDKGVPLPAIAKDVAPHLRPVVKQFTGILGKGKLMIAATAVNWKLNHTSAEEIQGYLDKAKKQAEKDVSEHSKDAMDVAQKFLNGLNPEEIIAAVENGKGAITQDMIEDVIAIATVVRDTLPPKLGSYLHDVLPEIDDLDSLIRAEAAALLKEDTGAKIDKVLKTAKEKASEAPDAALGDVQKTLIEKMEEIDAHSIKRIVDSIASEMTTSKLYALMDAFFKFADEAVDAFEQTQKPLRECTFKIWRGVSGKIARLFGNC